MPSDLGVFSLEDSRAMYAAFRELADLGVFIKNFRGQSFSLTGNIPRRLSLDSINVFNDSGFVIPPYGLMQVTTTIDIPGSKNYIKVKRPIDSTLMRCPMLINGPREIEVGGYGTAQDGPVFRLLHDNANSYDPGDRLGAKTGQFSATFGGLFSVLGPDDIDSNIVRVMFDTSPFKGKTISTLVVGTPGMVYARDASGAMTTKPYLSETDVSNIAGNTDIWLFPMYGRLVASKVC